MILAGDIGGTNTRLGLFDAAGLEPAALGIFPSREHGSLRELVAAFLEAHPERVDRACLGVAGPVEDGRRVDATNLAWRVDADDLRRVIGAVPVRLLNDLEANAYGLAALGEGDFEVLQPGLADARGNAAVVSAGTGLGEAGLFWDGARHHPFATEGGHTELGPRGELQVELYRWLAARHGHVSYERVCSGPGLVNCLAFLADRRGVAAPDGLDAPAISSAALAGSDPLAVAALDLFVDVYGAEAGNMALKVMARGGVFLGGGIAPRILPKLRDGAFVAAFRDKGRFRDLLGQVPIRVILNDRAALLGAALCAQAYCAQA